ncbi:MAG: hypothetical protein ACK5ZM_00750 [bacterium]
MSSCEQCMECGFRHAWSTGILNHTDGTQPTSVDLPTSRHGPADAIAGHKVPDADEEAFAKKPLNEQPHLPQGLPYLCGQRPESEQPGRHRMDERDSQMCSNPFMQLHEVGEVAGLNAAMNRVMTFALSATFQKERRSASRCRKRCCMGS